VPTEQGLGLDKEAPLANGRKQPAQPSEQCSVRWAQSRADDLAAQYRDLVAEHDDLDGQVPLRTA
jgi:hypothetical protein